MAGGPGRPGGPGSDLHDVLFLIGEYPVDPGHLLVGYLLDLFFHLLQVVLADGLVLLELAGGIVGVLAGVSDADPALLAVLARDLDELTTALLGKGGQVYAYYLAVV